LQETGYTPGAGGTMEKDGKPLTPGTPEGSDPVRGEEALAEAAAAERSLRAGEDRGPLHGSRFRLRTTLTPLGSGGCRGGSGQAGRLDLPGAEGRVMTWRGIAAEVGLCRVEEPPADPHRSAPRTGPCGQSRSGSAPSARVGAALRRRPAFPPGHRLGAHMAEGPTRLDLGEAEAHGPSGASEARSFRRPCSSVCPPVPS
jgi:hypothetical protein